jgi:hypothetical protein
VQTVCQFDEHHTDIIAHGKEGLAECFRDQVLFATARIFFGDSFRQFASAGSFCMLIAARDARQFCEFRHPVYETGDIVIEIPL